MCCLSTKIHDSSQYFHDIVPQGPFLNFRHQREGPHGCLRKGWRNPARGFSARNWPVLLDAGFGISAA